jgi:hypothetical protein
VIANDNWFDSSGANCHEHLKAQFQNMHCGTMITGAMSMSLLMTSMTRLGTSLRKTGSVAYV